MVERYFILHIVHCLILKISFRPPLDKEICD